MPAPLQGIITVALEGAPSLISGCQVDSHFFYCMMHYAPEVLLLLVFALVAVAGVWKYKTNSR